MANKINIKPDPCFDRLRKTLLLEEKPDRVPLCDFGIAQNIMEWVLDRPIQKKTMNCMGKVVQYYHAQDEIEFFYKAGYDFVGVWPLYNFALSDVKDREESVLAEGTGIIRTFEDLRQGDWAWNHIEDFCYANVSEVVKHLPSEMKIILMAHDIFTYTWENMGFTHFCNSLYEEPELVEELFSQIGHAVTTITERALELCGDKIGALWYADDLAFNTGTFVNPDVYRKYLFPWVGKLSQMTKEKGIPFLYHTDGKLWSIFDDFHTLGVNAIHPLEPKSMDAVEVKQKQGDRFCLVGNIDLDLLSRGTSKEVTAMVADRIQKLGYNGGYCVGSSNTVPAYVNPKNYKAMIEAVFMYGRL